MRLIYLIFFCFSFTNLFSQRISEPYILNQYFSFFNPAYTSLNSKLKTSTYFGFNSINRISWNSNFEIAIPSTNLRFGSNFHRDVIGQFWDAYTQINGAYLINLNEGDLIIGVSSTIRDRRIGADWLIAQDDIDPAVRKHFPSPNNYKQGYLFNTLGVVYTFKKYHFGAALENFGGVLVYGENPSLEENHYVNLSGGGELISHENFDVEVDCFVRTGNAVTSIRIVPTATIWSKLQVGLGHGIQDDVTPFIGYIFYFGNEKPQNLKLNLGGSITTSRIRTGSSPSYFLNLGYELN